MQYPKQTFFVGYALSMFLNFVHLIFCLGFLYKRRVHTCLCILETRFRSLNLNNWRWSNDRNTWVFLIHSFKVLPCNHLFFIIILAQGWNILFVIEWSKIVYWLQALISLKIISFTCVLDESLTQNIWIQWVKCFSIVYIMAELGRCYTLHLEAEAGCS